MSDEELVALCRDLYLTGGIAELSYQRLRTRPTLYTTLYHRGLRQSALLERLGLSEEYKAWKAVQPIKHGEELRERWTWDRVLLEAKNAKAAQGFLPPAAWWQATDSQIHSTHWSNADELLEYCKSLAAEQPDGEFPTEEWLRKRGKWANRAGPVYNTLSVYIKIWLGGVRKLREFLGQSHVSTVKWDRETVLVRWKAFRERYGLTPNAMRARAKRGQGHYPTEALSEAVLLASVVAKYAGGSAAADELTGFKPNRKKPRKKTYSTS